MNIDNIVKYNNNLYRIGDIIDNDNIEIYNYIKNNNNLSNSFIAKFLDKIYNKNINNKYERINIAANIVKNMLNNSNIAPNDSLIIHLRLGDVLNVVPGIFQEDIYNTIIKPRIPNIDFLLAQINKTTKKNIIIVTAYHHNLYATKKEDPNYKKYISQSNKNSEEFLKSFLNKIPKKYSFTIKSSNNPDDDFIFLCSAEELVLSSKSHFGIIAKCIQKILKNNKYFITNDNNKNNKISMLNII